MFSSSAFCGTCFWICFPPVRVSLSSVRASLSFQWTILIFISGSIRVKFSSVSMSGFHLVWMLNNVLVLSPVGLGNLPFNSRRERCRSLQWDGRTACIRCWAWRSRKPAVTSWPPCRAARTPDGSMRGVLAGSGESSAFHAGCGAAASCISARFPSSLLHSPLLEEKPPSSLLLFLSLTSTAQPIRVLGGGRGERRNHSSEELVHLQLRGRRQE